MRKIIPNSVIVVTQVEQIAEAFIGLHHLVEGGLDSRQFLPTILIEGGHRSYAIVDLALDGLKKTLTFMIGVENFGERSHLDLEQRD